MQLKETFERVKRASKSLALLTDEQRNEILNAVADAIIASQERILKANDEDLAKMDKANPLYDRLQLTPARLEGIAADMRNVATLPTPLGHITNQKTLPNGLRLCRVSVPFGVIGMIYEARPNVTFDVFSLCFKSGNACVLKGGKDADCSNREEVALIHEILEKYGINPDVVALLPATHEATGEMLNAVGYVDLCIPRGGRKLIDFVRDTARIPVIETGAGVVNTYFDKDGDLEMGKAIINNAKTRRVSVCNALDCLLIHESRLGDLAALCEKMAEKNVIIYADAQAYAALDGKYPYLEHATAESFGTEFMDYKLAIKTVASLNEPFIGTYLFQSHGTTRAEFLGGDTNLGTETELGTVGKRGGRIPIDTGGIDMGLEGAGCLFVHRNDGLTMAAAVFVDMGDGLFE